MEKITKSFLALVLMFVGMVSALAQPVAPKAPEAPAAPKATALVTDGSVKQYLYNVGAKGFFIGANDWGTRASFSAEKGYWVQITKNATGDTYTLKNEAKGGNSADCQAVDQIWVDGAGRAGDALWTVTANEDGSFKLGNTNVKGFLSVVPSKNDTKLYMSEAEEAQNVWIVVSEEDYAAYQEAVPAYQAALKEYNDAYAQYQKDYAEWFKANYKAGESLLPLVPSAWEGQTGTYGAIAGSSERYLHGGSIAVGDVMTQTIDGLKNGKYNVTVEFAGSFTPDRGFECPTGDGLAVAFANTQEENLPIVARVGVGASEINVFNFQNVEVSDGVLKYGIKNVAEAGNWYVAHVSAITMVPEPDAWYTGADFFRFRADKNAAAESPYAAFSGKVEPAWGADPDDPTNGCIICKVPANVDPKSQIWMRGTEAGKTIANGSKEGFKITFRVKADGEYNGLESQAHNNWGYKTGGSPFGTLDVTTEWQTVSFVCTGEKAKNDFTDLCFNLSGDAERTFYFDDVQIIRGGAEWYLNCGEIHAKDYQDPTATYADSDDPHPFARFVSDAEGGYVEVITNAARNNPWDSQIWIGIPAQYVGKSTKMTMKVWADKAVKCSENYHATATGKGWGASASPGSGLETTVGEWVEITRILNTGGVNCNGVYKNMQVDYYCLDLSNDEKGSGTGITYRFKDIKFEDAEEAWTTTMAYRVKVTPFTYNEETGAYDKGADTNAAPTYSFGTGGEEGGYFEVTAAGKQTNTYETQFFFQIADVAPSKALKKNETVKLSFKIKALATETLAAGTEIQAGGGFHGSYDGANWMAGAPAAKFTVGEWTPVELTLDISEYDKGVPTCYSIDLSQDANPITYLIDEVEATWAEAPVLDWVELISNGDCEAAPEHTFAAAKEVPVDGSGTHKARVLEGVGKDGSKGIEVVTAAKESQTWDNQFWIYEPYALPAGTNIIVEFDYKADLAGTVDTQSHNAPGGYLHWAAIGNTNFTTEWQHFKYEGKIASECDDNGTARFRSIAFNLSAIADANKFYFDNISFKVPSGTVDGLEPVYIDDYAEKEYIDPTTLDWSDNILKNGDLSGDDMSEFVLKNNDYEDPEMLPVEKTAFGDAFEIDVETAARPTNEDGSVGGNDHDAQFFVRLPYVLPKGKKFNLEFDLYAEEINTLAIQAHAEPGQWKGNLSSVKTDPAVDAVHYQEYLTAPEDMRTIAINLAVATDATYAFSNFSVQVVKDDMAEIEAATTEADAASLWNETLALNEACYAGRTTETEGQGYTDESVQALTDAIAAGKAELKNEAPTAESLAAATKAIVDAIAGLEKPKPELAYTDLTADMFFQWSGWTDAEATAQAYCEYKVGESSGQPYGDPSVNNYADLSGYTTLEVTVTEGAPRFLFNRDVAEGQWSDNEADSHLIDNTKSGWSDKYFSSTDNGDGTTTYVVDIAQLVADKGYAHLMAIKGANWANTTVTEMKLGYVGEKPALPVPTNIFEVADDAAVKDGKYFINGQIVIVKDGVKYNAAGVAIE